MIAFALCANVYMVLLRKGMENSIREQMHGGMAKWGSTDLELSSVHMTLGTNYYPQLSGETVCQGFT
jgi:hypothetical protein